MLLMVVVVVTAAAAVLENHCHWCILGTGYLIL